MALEKLSRMVWEFFNRWMKKIAQPQAIIVTPTRELAVQVHSVITQLAKYTQIKVKLAIKQETQDRSVVYEQVVVGTPGTLLAKMDKEMDVSVVKMLVADEQM